MKFNKILAGVLACCVIGGSMPSVVGTADNAVITANAVVYPISIYGSLRYVNYGDYIEITDCDGSATKVVIPDKIKGVPVTSIGNAAFSTCEELTSVTIPNSVTSIGDWAFSCCYDLTEITIPNSVTSIGIRAFSDCESLTSITIPDSVTSIEDGAFTGCTGLKAITISDNVTNIGIETFKGCSCLTSITIPDSATKIGDYAFMSCSGLISVTIPDSVTSIGDWAFYECYGLTSITILNPNCEIFDNRYTISNLYDIFNGTIYGYDNSTAQAYAEKYGYKFEILEEVQLGDVNGDNTIDSSDATDVLVDYSLTSTGKESQLTDAQKAAADVDNDGKIDSSDASYILQYYAYSSTGGTEKDMSKWMKNN